MLPGIRGQRTFSADGRVPAITDARGYYKIACPGAPVLLATWRIDNYMPARRRAGPGAPPSSKGAKETGVPVLRQRAGPHDHARPGRDAARNRCRPGPVRPGPRSRCGCGSTGPQRDGPSTGCATANVHLLGPPGGHAHSRRPGGLRSPLVAGTPRASVDANVHLRDGVHRNLGDPSKHPDPTTPASPPRQRQRRTPSPTPSEPVIN